MISFTSASLDCFSVLFDLKIYKFYVSTFCDTFMQERIAYQKLLKDFNRMEAATENLQDEVRCLNIICNVGENF